MNDGIGFLISDTARLIRRRFDERARGLGVTRPQWRTLLTLSRHEGLNQGALAELLEVEPITLCRMIDRLADAGHVERRRDPGDRRAWRIYLTEQARPLIERLRAIADDLSAAALDDVSDADHRTVTAALARIRANLSAPQEQVAHG